MHVYQMRSSVASVVSASQERINVCMNALKEVSKVWLVAKMVYTLFESILGNKMLEERLQKATGRKAPRAQKRDGVAPKNTTNGNANLAPAVPAPPPPQSNKRKFDDIDLGFSVGPPAPQVSYERSRPQTPALTPSRELNQQQTNNNMMGSPINHHHDLNLPTMKSRGGSRIHSRMGTRANSPFNGFSMPGTPPDLFLVTRNSPPISQQLWENFQPDQLFPDGSIDPSAINFASPTLNHAAVDPRLSMPNPTANGHQQSQSPNMSRIDPNNPSNIQIGPDLTGAHGPTVAHTVWPPGLDGMVGAAMDIGDSDRWSNSSTGAPIVPTTLNVEDWFQFFGIHGADMSSFGVEA